jgi:nucleolar complex protein 3
MAKKKRSRRGKNAGELPQAAPLASDSDDELDDDDVAFVSAHASYARGIANLAVDAIRAGKKRKTRASGGEDDENRTTAYEREHVASRRRAEEEEEDAKKKKKKREPGDDDDDDADATRAADRRDGGHLHRAPLPLPVKRLDGTVVHAPTAPAPISGDGVDDVLDALPKAARAALEKAREGARDAEEEDGKKMMPGAKKGKKAKRAAEMAEEMARTEYAQRASEKWWEGKENEEEDADGGGGDDGGGDSDDDDGDPAAAARRARSAAAEALEAELDDENRRVAIFERIATACRGVLEDPESRWKELRDVAKLVEDRDGDVARMAALSLVLVFKARSFSSPTLVPVRPRRCGEG